MGKKWFGKVREIVGIEVAEEEIEETPEITSSDMTRMTPAAERLEARSYKAPETSGSISGSTGKFTSQLKMVVIEPTEFNDSPKLVDSLKAKKPVIINLENIETDVARKIFDFLSGATYALNGNVQKIANNIFVFAPENVDVTYNQTQKASESYKNPWR